MEQRQKNGVSKNWTRPNNITQTTLSSGIKIITPKMQRFFASTRPGLVLPPSSSSQVVSGSGYVVVQDKYTFTLHVSPSADHTSYFPSPPTSFVAPSLAGQWWMCSALALLLLAIQAWSHALCRKRRSRWQKEEREGMQTTSNAKTFPTLKTVLCVDRPSSNFTCASTALDGKSANKGQIIGQIVVSGIQIALQQTNKRRCVHLFLDF